MPTLAARPTVRAAFERLIDYAGLFPPAKLELAPAVAEYGEVRDGEFAWMVGRFIANASITNALVDAVGERPAFPLSVIIDAVHDPMVWFERARHWFERIVTLNASNGSVRAEIIEVPLPPLRAARETYDATIGQVRALAAANLGDVPIYVELPRDDRWLASLPGAMAALARYGLRAKLRCGGVVAQAFPSNEEVARFIFEATGAGVPFKATAGLHHPIRHIDAQTGFPMHGFVNLLVATVLARSGAALDIVTAAIAEEEADAFVFGDDALRWRDKTFSVEQIRQMRQDGFVAYGSCSIAEPVDDLRALGILERAA